MHSRVRTICVVAVAAVALAVSAACGERPPAPATAQPNGPPPTRSAATATLSPSATADDGEFCPGASARDNVGRFLVSLAEPICIDAKAIVPASLAIEPLGRPKLEKDLTPADSRYVVLAADSPYGPSGCGTNPGYSLVISANVLASPGEVATVSLECRGVQVADGCAAAPAEAGLRLSGSGPGRPCLSWDDTYSSESGFRIEITYSRMGRTFAYLIPANSVVFQVPPEAGPAPTGSPECLQRKDVTISVVATFAGQPDRPIGSRSIVAECR